MLPKQPKSGLIFFVNYINIYTLFFFCSFFTLISSFIWYEFIYLHEDCFSMHAYDLPLLLVTKTPILRKLRRGLPRP